MSMLAPRRRSASRIWLALSQFHCVPSEDLSCGSRACYFTHGDRRTVEGHATVKIGKAWLVSRLQALAQSKRIHLPRTPEALAMERELMDYEIRIGPDANDRYGAFKVGSHDDLVTALGLAVQAEPFNVLIARV